MATDNELLERVMNMSDAEVQAELDRLGINTDEMMGRIMPAIERAKHEYEFRRNQRRALYGLAGATALTVLLIFLSNR